MMLEVRRFGG